MDKKEQARQEILKIIQKTLEDTHGYIAKFEVFFEDYVADNDFAQAAEAKLTLGKLNDFKDSMEETLRDPSDTNLKRFVDDSAAYASFCESMIT
jgi:hypothetical protein